MARFVVVNVGAPCFAGSIPPHFERLRRMAAHALAFSAEPCSALYSFLAVLHHYPSLS
jgi:hypothetical protein